VTTAAKTKQPHNPTEALMQAWGDFFQVPHENRQFLRVRADEFRRALREYGYDISEVR
jgi:hypothetical protein